MVVVGPINASARRKTDKGTIAGGSLIGLENCGTSGCVNGRSDCQAFVLVNLTPLSPTVRLGSKPSECAVWVLQVEVTKPGRRHEKLSHDHANLQ